MYKPLNRASPLRLCKGLQLFADLDHPQGQRLAQDLSSAARQPRSKRCRGYGRAIDYLVVSNIAARPAPALHLGIGFTAAER